LYQVDLNLSAGYISNSPKSALRRKGHPLKYMTALANSHAAAITGA